MNERQCGKAIATQVLRKYKLLKPSLDDLVYIASESGYEILDYDKNDDLNAFADRLSIQSYVDAGIAFTYRKNETKLIFLCESMTNDEKRYALAHELGHILCNHLDVASTFSNSVKEEYEANEFAHYFLTPPFRTKVGIVLSKYKIPITIVLSLLFAVGVSFYVWKYSMDEKPYVKEYYKTVNGEKYHEKDCIIIKDKNSVKRLTEKDVWDEKYEPCKVCLPN